MVSDDGNSLQPEELTHFKGSEKEGGKYGEKPKDVKRRIRLIPRP